MIFAVVADKVHFLLTEMNALYFGEFEIEEIKFYYFRDLLEFRSIPFDVLLYDH